jgi:hypothetical protein
LRVGKAYSTVGIASRASGSQAARQTLLALCYHLLLINVSMVSLFYLSYVFFVPFSPLSFIADVFTLLLLETGSCYVTQAGLKIVILLPQPPE